MSIFDIVLCYGQIMDSDFDKYNIKSSHVCDIINVGNWSVDLFNLENRRYIGSKADLSDWIIDLIQKNCIGSTFADIFAGTAIISKADSKIF